MSAINYGRSTEVKFVFIGPKVLLVSAMISEEHEPYVLYKEEKTNVEEVKVYIDNLKNIESVKKEYNFIQVLQALLKEKNFKEQEVEIVSVTRVSQTEYIFIIYHRRYKYRYRVRGSYDTKTREAKISKIEEVFSEKLQKISEPEQPTIRVIPKESLTKNVEAKEVFDYLYKIQPTFRQNLVESVKI